MDAPESKSLPTNAYAPLAPGEVYRAHGSGASATFPSDRALVGWGLFLCVIFTVASAYSGLKVGQVMEAAIPISILAIGLARVYRAPLDRAGERDHHQHRRRLRLRRRGRDLHAAGALLAEAQSASGADDLHLPGRRLSRRAVPDSAAPLLRPRDARPVAVSRRRRRSRRCWSPARRAARRRSCCCRPPASPPCTTSSSPRFRSGGSSSTSSSSRR